MENQESLREEYNPEGSELRRLQLRMLDMLWLWMKYADGMIFPIGLLWELFFI